MRVLPATDPRLEAVLAAALEGGTPLAPLPADPAATLAMLRPEEPVSEEDAALIVATSGSTGTPKGVVLSRSAVFSGVEATHARLGGPGHWTLAVPAHHMAGIMVTARALVAGTTLHRSATDLSDLPRLTGRNYLSVVPTQLVRALDHPVIVERLAEYDAILVGGAAAGQGLLGRCADRGLRVVTTYGMSETTGGCVYDGVPLDGVEVELRNDGPAASSEGRVAITGDVVFSGYRLRPDLTADALERDAATGRRTLLTRDRAVWSEGRLRVLGRIDDIVVSGGVNVDLAAVERALQQVDPTAVALGVPDPEWGTRVIAATTTDLTLAALRRRLIAPEPAARPRGLMRHPRLPLTASGKIDRQTLIAWWTAGSTEKEIW